MSPSRSQCWLADTRAQTGRSLAAPIILIGHSVRAPPDRANCGPRAVRAADRSSLALRPQAARSQLARSPCGVFQFRFGSSRSPSVLPETLSVSLKEDEGADDQVLAAGRICGRRGIGARTVERPARDRTVGDRVIALEHRNLGRLLLREPVP